MQPSTQSFDVAVVGAGIVGLTCAYELRRRGRSVVVLDRGQAAGVATQAAAGMLAPVSEAAFGERALLRANVESAARWPALAEDLAVPLLEVGALMVARDRDEAEALERELAFRHELGLPVERLLPSEARRREPALSPTVRAALDVPGEMAVDPRAVITALRGRLNDAIRAPVDVRSVAEVKERWAPRVVVAAGAWSGELAGVPVRPVKGQIARLRDPSGPGLVERIVRMSDAYLVPRGDGRYVLGATVEERGWDASVTAGGVFELLRDAIELVPGLAELEVEELGAGFRPGTPDNAPLVGPDPSDPDVVLATGHYRNGVLLAPLTAALVAALVDGDDVEVPGVLDPRRFTRQPA